tara:strand:- start:1199 stop:1906 length:708 start_codon:yes stop_codon:yes gene_type:complete
MDEISYSIVCCYYNEKPLLEKKLNSFVSACKNLPFKNEIIFCDNSSTDGTIEILKNLEKLNYPNLKFIFNNKNLGKGGSIKKAIDNSRNDYIVIFDLDEYLIEDLLNAHEIIKDSREIDFLCGTRLGENNRFLYKKNLYGVILLTKLINLLYKTNLTDSACATKIFKKTIYNQLKIKTNGFDFEFEVLCKFAKLKHLIKEYKVQYYPRSFEEGKKLRAVTDGSMILKTIIKSLIT